MMLGIGKGLARNKLLDDGGSDPAVNVVAGASSIRFADYVAGTVLGLLPGLLLMSAFGYQIYPFLVAPTAAAGTDRQHPAGGSGGGLLGKPGGARKNQGLRQTWSGSDRNREH
jgi:hypothetical protein